MNVFNDFIHGVTSRRIILIISLLFSVGLYRYVINNLYDEGEDFISTIWSGINSDRETMYLFSGDANGGDYSLYYQLGKKISEAANKENFLLELKGTQNSALSNAFGVLNNTNSFGIVQSDTHLHANFLKDASKIKTICSLYMERLHILAKFPKETIDKNPDFDNLLFGSGSEFKGNRIIQKAIEDRTIITGNPTSSARNYLPFLLKEGKIDYSESFSNIQYGSYVEIFDFLENSENRVDEVLIAVFTLGTHDKVKELLKDPQYKLIAIDPSLISIINSKYNQRLELTYFDDVYDYSKGLPTIGAYAQLVASSDVSDLEITKFLEALNTVTDNSRFDKIFEKPPISLYEVTNYYNYQYRKSSTSLLASFMIFITSVIFSTVVSANFIMWFTSNYKKVKYYREFIVDYNRIIDTSESYKNPEAKIENLTRGMHNILLIASEVRNDFETGGMTNSDHEYLIENLNHILELYKERLAQRMNDKLVKSVQKLSKSSSGYLITSLKEEINQYYSDDYLSRESYLFLISEIRIAMESQPSKKS